MRLRHKPWAEEKLKAYPQYAIQDPQALKGKWQDHFAKKQALHLEIGSGKGQFILGMAQAHPDVNYIAMELQTSAIISILNAQIEAQLPNLLLINGHGGDIDQFFAPGEVDRLYLNFSDPWPKKRHAKRRLTSPQFLKKYRHILTPQGEIHFKTDNQGLFEYSLASLSQYGYQLKQVWLDLHQSDFEGNIQSEYEEKFAQKGQAIYRLEAVWPQS